MSNDIIYATWGSQTVKASACNAQDLGSIPGLGRSPGEGNGNPLQYSCLENFVDWNDAKAEAPVLWPPHVKSGLTGKDSDAGRDWGQEEKETTEDEMAGWHH